MTSSIEESSVCSPDSTVSSLLASYSIDSNNPYSNSLIHYKDKLYSSASEALEAYIEDFDLSLTSSEVSTGKICICQSTPKQVKFSKRHAKEKRGMSCANMPFNKFSCLLGFFFSILFIANGIASACLTPGVFC